MMTTMGYNLNIEPVLESDLRLEPPLMRVVVADLAGSRKDITKIFALSKDIAPVDRLKHLRRVRNTKDGPTECILADIEPDAITDERSFIDKIKKTLEDDRVILKNYRIAEVPSIAAKTNAQLESYCNVWPVKYMKSEYLIKCLEGTIIDESERLVAHIITNGLIDHMTGEDCEYTSGSVIFRYAKVYGAGLSCGAVLEANPTKHSSMVAIDAVARDAGAGHWPADHHAGGNSLVEKLQVLLDARAELADHKMDANFLPYICTNYDIITTEEPCMMCSMALIQSRIRRLYYLDTSHMPNKKQAASFKLLCYPDKAIEEFFIHRDKSINHRFEAWRIKLVAASG